jgi:hypothetical protein
MTSHGMCNNKLFIKGLLTFFQSSVFQLVVQGFKDQDTQNYNFARCSVWVRNLVADIEGET